MAQGSNPDAAEPRLGSDRVETHECPDGECGQTFYVANDPKMASTLLTLANVMLSRKCGRQVADDYASEIAYECFKKINSILDEDNTGIIVTDAYLKTHVYYRILNLFKTLRRERVSEEGRLPIEADQLVDPYDDEWEDAEVRRVTRCSQIQLMVLRCLDEHLKKRDKSILLQHLLDVPQAQLARRWKLSAPRIHQIIAKSTKVVTPCLEDGRSRLEVA